MNQLDLQIGSAEWLKTNNIHCFSHHAMATIFEIFIAHADQKYASQAADEAFNELDRLEEELSRFIENSDIARINNLKKDTAIIVGPDVFECLQACQTIYDETNGAFDISAGQLTTLWRERSKLGDSEFSEQLQMALAEMGREKVEINPATYEVRLLRDRIYLDLGGFGKGYALDRMAELMQEWSISSALLNGGRSSAKALAGPSEDSGWPVSISDPEDSKSTLIRISLRYNSLSGSGLQKGSHIIDPRTGYPVSGRKAAWASSPSAAISDALSTAFMIMPEREIKNYIRTHEDVAGLILLAEKNKKGQNFMTYGRIQALG